MCNSEGKTLQRSSHMFSASSLVAEWVRVLGFRRLVLYPRVHGLIPLLDTLPRTDKVSLLHYQLFPCLKIPIWIVEGPWIHIQYKPGDQGVRGPLSLSLGT